MRLLVASAVAAAIVALPLIATAQKAPAAAAPSAAPSTTPSAAPSAAAPEAPPSPSPAPAPSGDAPSAAPYAAPAAAPPPPPPGWGYPGYPPGYQGRSLDEEPYFEGATVPPGYHIETRISKGPVITGSVLFGVAYVTAAAVATASVSDGVSTYATLYIPVVGPFIAMTQTNFGGRFGGLNFLAVGMPLLLDGLTQAAGSITLIAGLNSSRRVVVQDGAATDTTPRVRFGGDRIVIEGRF